MDKFRILFVDDEAENLNLFQRVFRRDYEIHLADSADRALAICEEHDIDIVLSDQKMPGKCA